MKPKQNWIERVVEFVRYEIWRKTDYNQSKKKSWVFKILKTILLSIQGFMEHKVLMRADALAYAFLFAIVPIVSLMLAITKGFGFEAVLEENLSEIPILKGTNLVPTLMEMVERYLDTAQGGVFIGVGLIVLLWSIYLFFHYLETSFNEIWSVRKSRNIIRQISSYVIIVVAIPTLIVCTSGVSVFINSTLPETDFFVAMAPVKEFLLRLSPFVVAWLFFSWMYWAIPNTKVGAAAAFVPGVLIGTLFQVLQMISVWLIAFLGRYSIVYGTFAAIPLILLWLEWISVLIFYGAEMSYAIQHNNYYDYHTDLESMSRRYKDYITIYIVRLIVRGFEEGKQPLTAQEIADENRMPIRLVNNLTSRLVEAGVLRETLLEDDEECGFVPAIDIHKMTVGYVIQAIEKQGIEEFLDKPTKEMKALWTEWKEGIDPNERV